MADGADLKTENSTKEDGSKEKAESKVCSKVQAEIMALQQKEKELDAKIKQLEDEGYREDSLKAHVEKLHELNDIKDATQIVFGRLAELQNVPVSEIHVEYGLEEFVKSGD